jgi:hypothetical protein
MVKFCEKHAMDNDQTFSTETDRKLCCLLVPIEISWHQPSPTGVTSHGLLTPNILVTIFMNMDNEWDLYSDSHEPQPEVLPTKLEDEAM